MARKHHVPGTLPYFSVSGERKELVLDENEKPTGSRILPAKVRFESLALQEAEKFATSVYKAEGIVLEIHEISR